MNVQIKDFDFTYPLTLTSEQIRTVFYSYALDEPEQLLKWIEMERRLKRKEDLGEDPLRSVSIDFSDYITLNSHTSSFSGISSCFVRVRGIIYNEYT